MTKFLISVPILVGLLIGCASEPPAPPPPPPPTVVKVDIEPAANLNADINGNGSPLMLRIYELTEQSNFNSADFFALFDNDKAVLAAALERKHQLLLQPNDPKSVTLQTDDKVVALGFFAAFRKIDNAQWRVVTKLKPHETQGLKIKIDNNQMTLEAQP